jgi:hypothetical protein
MPEKLTRKAVSVYRLSATMLPIETDWRSVKPADENTLATELASLGYPGLSHLNLLRMKNPAAVLLRALSAGNLDSHLVEALPWVVCKYPEMDWQWLTSAVKINDL